ncbi:MAG: phosphatase PAP2 family protein [Patescibacteria group bacterium]
MLKILLRPEAFIYIAFVVFTGAFFVLSIFTKDIPSQGLLKYYIQLSKDKIIWSFVLLSLVVCVRILFFGITAALKGTNPSLVFSHKNLARFPLEFSKFLKNLLLVGLPFLFSFYSLTLALGQLNLFNKDRLQDELLAQWDIALTHTFPSFTLASLQYPGWFIKSVDFSFMYLVPFLGLLGAYLFQARQKLFREAAGTFSVGMIFMFTGWILFPVLSPHDRFVDNVYNLPPSPSIQEYLVRYHPQEEISLFLQRIRESKEDLGVFPTSAFPSAHVAWAVLFVYYAYRTSRWLLLFSIPLAFLSTLGTVLFAQHYFVDIPAGIGTGLLAIAITRYVAQRRTVYLQYSSR